MYPGLIRDAMPGITELTQFRDELSKLGNEREVTASWGEVYEELPLPDTASAASADIDVDGLLSSIGDETPSGSSEFSLESLLDNPDPEEAVDPGEAIDPGESIEVVEASDIGDISDAVEIPDFEDMSDAGDAVDSGVTEQREETSGDTLDSILDSLSLDTPETFDDSDFGTPSFPEDLLETMEEAPSADEGGETLPEDLSGFELPDYGDTSPDSGLLEIGEAELDKVAGTSTPEEDSFGVPEDLLAGFADDMAQSAGEVSGEIDSFDIPDFPSDFGSTPDDQMSGIESLLNDSAGDEERSPLMPDLDDSLFPPVTTEESAPAAENFLDEIDFTPEFEEKPRKPGGFTASAGFEDFTIPDDLEIPEEDSASAAEPDGFEGFVLDEDFLQTAIESVDQDDEFHIPGFSDFTSGPVKGSSGGADGTGRKTGKKEISMEISEQDFGEFLSLLSHYPLNVRIAIEEYLSKDMGTDLHKMEVVHHVLDGTPIRKIARNLEDALGRSIPVPKDFEKKNFADYEAEKQSLRYVFFNKILPVAVIGCIGLVLLFCITYLSWMFVYRPIVAESLYKRGYAAIEQELYSQSLDYFDKAVEQWEKKHWYFRYARAYRDHQQYIMAGNMYERILYRFRNDRIAGLEYAEMLRTDLRNYEKAETVLKRRVLDHHVNDSDALMLLGDTYLDWAYEDFSKYEEARKTYAVLIELYGRKDPYLARMMRYFIRTDNLVEVLPLKDHFMRKGTRIGASDLVELGGYLLEKRYESGSDDNEELRSKIEDVRTILERAVKADESIPEAHYNIGRFFIYNYNPDRASRALSEALRLFDSARGMNPRRVRARLDSFRLLGELRMEDKEYLRAQKLFADAISYYEQQRENRSVSRDPIIGKLYANFADIEYFIANDLSVALYNYEKAVSEMMDTASVRFRIGYIYYHRQDYEKALQSFMIARSEDSTDPNILYSMGNTLFRRESYHIAHAHYETLMEQLDAERLRKGIIFPQARADYGEFVETYMRTANNLGVTLERLASRTGDSRKNARALSLYAESARAWDTLTRNPETLIRSGGSNLASLNIQNMTRPLSQFVSEIYADIPKTLEGERILQQREDQ